MAERMQSSKLLRIILVVSLGLNILLVGGIIGRVATGGAGQPRSFDLQIGPLGQALPQEDRAAIGRSLREALRDRPDGRRTRNAAAEAVITMLEADTLDPEELAETIRGQQDWQNRVRETALDAFVSHIGTMTLQERRDIAATLRDRMKRGKDRR